MRVSRQRNQAWQAMILTLSLLAWMVPALPATAVVTDACPSTVADAPFADLAGHGLETLDAIACVFHHQVAKGVSSTGFDPAGEVTRWQMALFLTRTAQRIGISLPSGAHQGFLDLATLDPATATAINQLAQLGITEGVSATAFDPFGTVTRWQMALFLTRLVSKAGISLPSGATQGFRDIGTYDSATQKAINQLAQLGITKGTTPTLFEPSTDVVRWQMALFLARSLEVGEARPYSIGITLESSKAHPSDAVTATVQVTDPRGVAVENLRVDIFVASDLTTAGECLLDSDASIDNGDAGTSQNCRLDLGDPRTDMFGRVVVELTHSSVAEKDLVYAWVGEVDDLFDVDLVRTYTRAALEWVQPSALHAEPDVARFGSSSLVEAWLEDAWGDRMTLSGQEIYAIVNDTITYGPIVTGSNGIAQLSYRGPSDPSAGDDPAVVDEVTLFWDIDQDGEQDGGELGTTTTVRWDDTLPVENQAEITQTEAATLLNATHTVRVTVTDKFGSAISNARVVVRATGATPVQQVATTGSSGVVTVSWKGVVTGKDLIEAQVDFDRDGEIDQPVDLDWDEIESLDHYWVATAPSLSGRHDFVVLRIDTTGNLLDVYDLGTGDYLRLTYGTSGDLYTVDGVSKLLDQFEAVLADYLDHVDRVTLFTEPYSSASSLLSWFHLGTS